MADEKTRGLQMLADLYPDPTIRAARVEELGDAGVALLGKHGLRQDDYSRQSNELVGQRTALTQKEADAQALYESNKAWFDQKQADLQELDRLRQAAGVARPGGTVATTTPVEGTPKYVTAEQLEATERGAVAFFRDLNRLSLEHYQRFGEILDTDALLSDKRVQQIGILGVYGEKHKAQLDALDLKTRQAAEEKIRADERSKIAVERASAHHPYPVRGNEPSTLDAMEAARASTTPVVAKTIDEMAQEYARLNAVRAGVT